MKPHTFLHESSSRPHETKYLFYTNQPPVHRRPHTFLHESAFHPHETAYPFTRYQPSLHTKPHTLLHKFGYSRLPVPLSHRKTIYKARFTRIRIFLKLHTVHTFLHYISLPSTRNSIPFYTISAFRPHETAYLFTRISLPSTRNRIPFNTNQPSVYTKTQTFYTRQPSVHTKPHTFLHESISCFRSGTSLRSHQ